MVCFAFAARTLTWLDLSSDNSSCHGGMVNRRLVVSDGDDDGLERFTKYRAWFRLAGVRKRSTKRLSARHETA